MKLSELAEIIGTSKECIDHIIHEVLQMKKVGTCWVRMDRSVRLSKDNLTLMERNKKKSRQFVTMDETWIHHYTPQSNGQFAEWNGITFIDYIEHGKTVNKSTGRRDQSVVKLLGQRTPQPIQCLPMYECVSALSPATFFHSLLHVLIIVTFLVRTIFVEHRICIVAAVSEAACG